MAALAASQQEYADLVQGVLDLVEEAVSSPLLALSIQEPDLVGQYHRIGTGVESGWGEAAAAFGAEVVRQDLARSSISRPRQHHRALPPIWMALFPAVARPGVTGALSLAAPEPLSMTQEEEQLMLRLAQHAVLVLDHAMLRSQVDDLQVFDRLTGATSHRRLLEVLEYELSRHRHAGKRLVLLMVDIEGLDRINRRYGRQYGNHILRRLADLIRQTVRSIDVVARCGVDEFAVLLPEIGEEGAEELVSLICERILGAEFAGGTVGVSAGLAQVRPDELLGAEEVLQRAEQALAEAKRQDRSRSALLPAGGWAPRLG
jgi:diguanylate cyclase (GGDEF)-like protein